MRQFYFTDFKLSKDGETLVQDLSNLDHDQTHFWEFSDGEFVVISDFTNREIIWTLNKIHQVDLGKITKWEFSPSQETIEKHPKINRRKLIIFNI